MAVEKQIKTRIQQKHDIEANWNLAVNFIPKDGELIIYDPDEVCSYRRIKIGDGINLVKDLPFFNYISADEIDEICSAELIDFTIDASEAMF